MTKLREDIKRILSALAYQDADEYLSSYEKMKILENEPGMNKSSPAPTSKVEKRPARSRIALIIDGQDPGATLSYAIDACQRQDAQLDLLMHGAIDTENVARIESKIIEAGLNYQRIQIGLNAIDDIIQYILNQPSLIYLVSMSEDAVVREIIEDVLPKRGQRIPVPLVLMNSEKPDCSDTQRTDWSLKRRSM